MAPLVYNSAGNTGFDMRSLDLGAPIASKTATAFNPVKRSRRRQVRSDLDSTARVRNNSDD
jgi:hypothetical protein